MLSAEDRIASQRIPETSSTWNVQRRSSSEGLSPIRLITFSPKFLSDRKKHRDNVLFLRRTTWTQKLEIVCRIIEWHPLNSNIYDRCLYRYIQEKEEDVIRKRKVEFCESLEGSIEFTINRHEHFFGRFCLFMWKMEKYSDLCEHRTEEKFVVGQKYLVYFRSEVECVRIRWRIHNSQEGGLQAEKIIYGWE